MYTDSQSYSDESESTGSEYDNDFDNNIDTDFDADGIDTNSKLNYRDKIERLIIESGMSHHITVDDLCGKQAKCKYYTNNCKLFMPCCNKYYCCCRCHDQLEDHQIDRKKINKMMCSVCSTEQQISERCVECSTIFAKYICLKCLVFDTSSKNIYHCNKCKFCMVTPGVDGVKHCNKCNCCIPNNMFKEHKCLTDRLKSDCPICFEVMSPAKQLMIMKCGHGIHEECYNESIKHSYKCPMCKKTITDMHNVFADMDREIAETPIPADIMKDVSIYCNDCQKTCTTRFHYIGTKCVHCGSYNTQQN